VGVTIAVDVPDGVPSYYVNWIEISHTKWDFCIIGATMPARHNQSKIAELKATRVLTLNADVQLIIPPTLLPGLISALTIQKEKFEKEMNMELKEV
jgi:hypothetical protein